MSGQRRTKWDDKLTALRKAASAAFMAKDLDRWAQLNQELRTVLKAMTPEEHAIRQVTRPRTPKKRVLAPRTATSETAYASGNLLSNSVVHYPAQSMAADIEFLRVTTELDRALIERAGDSLCFGRDETLFPG